MLRIVLLTLTLFAQPLSLLAIEPTEKVAKHLGKAAIEILQKAEKIEAFRVGDSDHTQPGAEGRIAYRTIVGEPVSVGKDAMARLVAALLSEDTYFRADSKGTKTAVGYRIWNDKNDCLEASCCLVKGNVCILVKDADGKVLVHGDRRGFRDDRASPMRFIAAELFPNDKDVQAAKPKLDPAMAPEPPAAPKDAKVTTAEAGVLVTKVNSVDVEIFIPDVKKIRGVIVHAANYGLPIKTSDRWAELGRELAFAHVAMRIDPKANNRPVKLHHALIEGLKEFAQKSGHPELATAPLAGVGHSAGGMVVPALHLSPERMLTSCVDCGWVSDPEKWPTVAIGVPALFTMGAIPDAFKMLPSIDQHYEPARKKNMPWGLGLQWDCAHDFANAATLQAPWVRAVAKARISETDGKLLPIKLEDGWLGDRKSIDGSFATVASWSDYKGDRSAASWFPDREIAYIWRAWQSKSAPLILEAITSDGKAKLPAWNPKASRGMTVEPGTVLDLSVTVKEGAAPRRVTYFAGDRAIGEAESSPWKVAWSAAPGLHAVWAQWEDADGKLGAANPALIVVRQK